MNNNYKINIYRTWFCLLVIIFYSCNRNTISSYDDYLEWLNNTENGLVATKQSNGVIIKVKHLPSNYLAYQDLLKRHSIEKETVDSLVGKYDKSLTFLVTVGVDGRLKKGDIMYQGIHNYEEYKKRLYAMNFDIEKSMKLTMDNKTYRPVLSHLENGYGLKDSRNIMMVFVPEEKEDVTFYSSNVIKFTYDDEIFNTGINHFKFNRKDLDSAPLFTFWN